jgi:glycosyltransferase involved in cell wall biosynthesis
VSLLHRANRVLTALDFHRQALGAVRALRPALLHCNDHNTMWTGVLAKLAWGTPLVYDAHELWPDRNGRWEWRPGLLAAEALFVRMADAVVTASPGYAQEMSRRYRVADPVVVLNVPDAAPPPGAPPARDGDPALVYIGGLLPGRGLEIAIRSLAFAPDATLDLIGPVHADYATALAHIAVDAKVEERVRIIPPVAPDEVVERLTGYDAGLSLIEPICRSYELTMPNKVFEYLAAGVPVLASDMPTQAAFVRDHPAGVVTRLNPHAVAASATAISGATRQIVPLRWADQRDALAAAYAAARTPKRRSCSRENSRYSEAAARMIE